MADPVGVPNPAGPEGREPWRSDAIALSRPSRRLVQLADALPDWMGSVRFRLTALYSLVLFGLAAFMVAGLYALIAMRLHDEKVYVTQFLGVDRPGVLIGSDDYKEGRVAVIATANHTLLKQAVLPPRADTGFKSDGSLLKRIAATEKVTTAAFPNMLQAVAIKGGRAYLPNTCASPDAPVRFNVNMQACLTVLDTGTDAEGQASGKPQSINLNSGVQFEVADEAVFERRLFHAVPWAVAFKHKCRCRPTWW